MVQGAFADTNKGHSAQRQLSTEKPAAESKANMFVVGTVDSISDMPVYVSDRARSHSGGFPSLVEIELQAGFHRVIQKLIARTSSRSKRYFVSCEFHD
jgi:hypothetical protein